MRESNAAAASVRCPLPTVIPHHLRAVVGVASRAVPVAWDGLRVERARDAKVLAHPEHDVARHPAVVTGLDARARADLVLPLAWQHLSVDA